MCGIVATTMCTYNCWCVIYSFDIFRLYNGREGDQRPKYVLDLRTFVAEKLPDDGTLMPKHVGVGTWYEVFCDPFYCLLINAFC